MTVEENDEKDNHGDVKDHDSDGNDDEGGAKDDIKLAVMFLDQEFIK